MTGPPRDWDKEMAEIDKIIAKEQGAGSQRPVLPAQPALPAPRAVGRSPAGSPTAGVPAGRRARLTGWVRVLLGVAVAVGVAQWPYHHACGFALDGYIAAASGVVLAGLWGAVTTWRRRMGLAHVISLLVVLAGGLLLGKAVLDRTSYPAHPAVWRCG